LNNAGAWKGRVVTGLETASEMSPRKKGISVRQGVDRLEEKGKGRREERLGGKREEDGKRGKNTQA